MQDEVQKAIKIHKQNQLLQTKNDQLKQEVAQRGQNDQS
jgi:hypothetical protein